MDEAMERRGRRHKKHTHGWIWTEPPVARRALPCTWLANQSSHVRGGKCQQAMADSLRRHMRGGGGFTKTSMGVALRQGNTQETATGGCCCAKEGASGTGLDQVATTRNSGEWVYDSFGIVETTGISRKRKHYVEEGEQRFETKMQ